MHIFTAGITAVPGGSGALRHKVPAIRDSLKDATGQDWSAWAGIAGMPYGSFALSVTLNGVADIIDGQMKAAASARFQELSSELGGLSNAPTESFLNEIVAITGDVAETKSIVTWTRATLAGGQMGVAMGWAVNVMQHITDLTGVGGVVATASAGPMFSVSWIMSVDTGQQADEINAKVNADAEYLTMLDAGAGYFIPGSAERLISVRLP